MAAFLAGKAKYIFLNLFVRYDVFGLTLITYDVHESLTQMAQMRLITPPLILLYHSCTHYFKTFIRDYIADLPIIALRALSFDLSIDLYFVARLCFAYGSLLRLFAAQIRRNPCKHCTTEGGVIKSCSNPLENLICVLHAMRVPVCVRMRHDRLRCRSQRF